MCLAIPAKIIECDPGADTALVDLSGIQKRVSLMLVEGAQVGDYVLVHVGFALKIISENEAEKTLSLFDQAGTTHL